MRRPNENHRLTKVTKDKDNLRADEMRSRADSALSKFRAVRGDLKVVVSESSKIRSQIHQDVQDLRIMRMKSWVLLSEIKLGCLEGSALCSVFAVPKKGIESRPYGHPVQ
jgi:hypothetical protein